MLTGPELLAKMKTLGQVPEAVAAEACGYSSADGKIKTAAFKNALLVAHGLAFSKPVKAPSRGKPLSYLVKAGTTGNIVLSGGYSSLIGIVPGSKVAIEQVGATLVLSAAAE